MPPRRAGSSTRRCRCRCLRVRQSNQDRRGRREEERRLAREMKDLLQRSRQLGRTALTRMLWQSINYGVEQGVLQVYTGPLPNLPPPPAAPARRSATPTPQLQPPPPPPPTPPPRGTTPDRSGVLSTEQPRSQVEETAAGCAGVTRVAFHPTSPECDRSDDAVIRATGTANRGAGSGESVGVLRRLLSFVLYPLKVLLWPLPRPRPSVRVLELPDAAAAAAAAATADSDGDSGDNPNPSPAAAC